jgi:hypothetical protein
MAITTIRSTYALDVETVRALQGRASGVVGPKRDARSVIHLDTSFLIRAMTPKSTEDRRLRGWLVADESMVR